MKPPFKETPYDTNATKMREARHIDASVLPVGKGFDWSVRRHTLRGGMREGVEVVEIDNGKLSFAVLPTRGMGIWKGRCGPMRLGWDSPVKDPVHPAFVNPLDRGGLGWLKGFNEWIVRCGLASMGPPGTDVKIDDAGNASESFLTLHGNIANIPARKLEIEITDSEIILRGEVDEAMLFGPTLRLNTEIRTAFGTGALTINDTVSNIGCAPCEYELLYHVNYGGPLLEAGARWVAPYRQIAPRDKRSAEGVEGFDRFEGPEPGFAEQVYWCDLAGKNGDGGTLAMLRNAKGDRASVLRYKRDDFPCFALWKNTAAPEDGYVTGLEPCTCFPNARQFEREKGRLPTLRGGESKTTSLTVEALDEAKAVQAAEAEVRAIQEGVEPKVHPQPIPEWSAV